MKPVRVIAGLGNPGREYDGTRHNIGFALLDHLASKEGLIWKRSSRFSAQTAETVLQGQTVLLLKPLTYMNASGRSLQEVCRFYRWSPEQIIVAYDEFQIALGQLKVSLRGSAGGHNGVEDIIQRLGGGFIRYRIGIAPEVKPLVPLHDFVLGKFAENELLKMNARMDALVQGLNLILEKGALIAMNQLNQRIPIE